MSKRSAEPDESTCYGCNHDRGGQRDHMGPGGCLSVEEDSEPIESSPPPSKKPAVDPPDSDEPRAPEINPVMTVLWFYKQLCSPPSTIHHFDVKSRYDAKYGAGSFEKLLTKVQTYVDSVDFSAVPIATV